MKLVLPKNIVYIIDQLNTNGYEAWCVGGCVRDTLLEIQPDDWDIATNATPFKVAEIFPNTLNTGIKHGTVTVIIDHEPYEITTFRAEGNYSDFRRPDHVLFVSSIETDLSRRDFTINALAWHPEKGMKDLFGGIKDLSDRIIRCVGDPKERFKEDALRMLRAIRFQAQLNFALDIDTKKAICTLSKLITKISKERILVELNKILMSNNPGSFFTLYETGLIKYILPKLYNKFQDNERIFKLMLPQVPKILSYRWAALFIILNSTDSDEIGGWLRGLKMDKKTLVNIKNITYYYPIKGINNPYSLRKLISLIGNHVFTDVITIQTALMGYTEETYNLLELYNELIENNICTSLNELDISGSDIIKCNLAQGKDIGKILNILLEQVLLKPELNKKEILLKMAKEIKRKNS